jgi:hypothetical protein
VAHHNATLSGIGGYLAEACPTATGLVQLRTLARSGIVELQYRRHR